MTTEVYLEEGAKRIFACAVKWPGWCRSGKDQETALEALAESAPRFAVVADVAGVRFPAREGSSFTVVERVAGSASTDFGVPGAVADLDTKPLTKAQAEPLVQFLTAAWKVFDDVVAGAPTSLRKGPRGGGRDRDKMVEHVLGAEAAYARKLGIRLPQPDLGDTAAIWEVRDAVRRAIGEARGGEPLVEKGWPPRYAARRIAWHAIDHAWEIEDRSGPDSP